MLFTISPSTFKGVRKNVVGRYQIPCIVAQMRGGGPDEDEDNDNNINAWNQEDTNPPPPEAITAPSPRINPAQGARPPPPPIRSPRKVPLRSFLAFPTSPSETDTVSRTPLGRTFASTSQTDFYDGKNVELDSDTESDPFSDRHAVREYSDTEEADPFSDQGFVRQSIDTEEAGSDGQIMNPADDSESDTWSDEASVGEPEPPNGSSENREPKHGPLLTKFLKFVVPKKFYANTKKFRTIGKITKREQGPGRTSALSLIRSKRTVRGDSRSSQIDAKREWSDDDTENEGNPAAWKFKPELMVRKHIYSRRESFASCESPEDSTQIDADLIRDTPQTLNDDRLAKALIENYKKQLTLQHRQTRSNTELRAPTTGMKMPLSVLKALTSPEHEDPNRNDDEKDTKIGSLHVRTVMLNDSPEIMMKTSSSTSPPPGFSQLNESQKQEDMKATQGSLRMPPPDRMSIRVSRSFNVGPPTWSPSTLFPVIQHCGGRRKESVTREAKDRDYFSAEEDLCGAFYLEERTHDDGDSSVQIENGSSGNVQVWRKSKGNKEKKDSEVGMRMWLWMWLWICLCLWMWLWIWG
ncbi:hypothetical protein K505DRAFT_362457 [Melanomma pulvis-pyrius CBS 109.77]|uniref:Uncharacterized protein n=1 Tax=Melanomma pulvis-pyrius CBS 109.77 TaxID=1314802 RepID=A0A6A6XAH9_9PLEO|nr:hypothetical protein K505DRAFT_362457 [Melanomma pulvis-pyrius CBS 109.77]